jgi:hypothetical protein
LGGIIKNIKIAIEDLLVVLQSMREEGTTEIVFCEKNGYPALYDFDNADSYIMFQGVDGEGNVNDESEEIH